MTVIITTTIIKIILITLIIMMLIANNNDSNDWDSIKDSGWQLSFEFSSSTFTLRALTGYRLLKLREFELIKATFIIYTLETKNCVDQ